MDASWSNKLGLATDQLSKVGFGVRTQRYALVVDDLKVTFIAVRVSSPWSLTTLYLHGFEIISSDYFIFQIRVKVVLDLNTLLLKRSLPIFKQDEVSTNESKSSEKEKKYGPCFFYIYAYICNEYIYVH